VVGNGDNLESLKLWEAQVGLNLQDQLFKVIKLPLNPTTSKTVIRNFEKPSKFNKSSEALKAPQKLSNFPTLHHPRTHPENHPHREAKKRETYAKISEKRKKALETGNSHINIFFFTSSRREISCRQCFFGRVIPSLNSS
jgi:hypothetical protein